ncbi:aldo/keto reductase [Brevundimonas guildfordensis]|uniref:Aldo/keto reductase n=1 Tax=Brevundimonas guildfordensis TaxID=2762241 RepID=A0ABR8R035_9CAUL|nr:aldo/keto reductase [Brevundimonas guildfordensis]MBD7941098.1 aldo/keto reductase [Brevundimonas guildfordensis]
MTTTKRALGGSSLTLSPLVFGGNVFGWTADKARSFALLDRFAEAGFETIDTADVYSTWVPGNAGGESEAIIGEWMKARGNRDQINLITKVGMQMPDGQGLSAAWIEQAVEASLRRLQTDRIDLYFSHVFDEVAPVEETLSAYDRLIKAGKVRAIGASNHTAEQLATALKAAADNGLPRYEALQPQYNLYDRDGYDGALRDLALREGLGVITYYSLASGFLTGKYRSQADLGKSPRGGGVAGYLNERGLRVLAALDAVAAEHQATPAEIALAWLIAREGVTAPIASATSLEQLDGLIRSTQITLTAGDITRLDQASAA